MKYSLAAALVALAAPLHAQQPNAQASDALLATSESSSSRPPLAAPFGSGELERLLAARPMVSGTLSLDEAVSTALRESPVVRGASEEVEAALGRLNAARAEQRPSLSANTFLSGGSLPNIVESPDLPVARMIMGLPRGGYFDQNLMLMAPLLTGGRLKTLVRQAQARREASQAEMEGQRQEIALLARTAFREVQARRALVEVQQARLRENEEQLRLDRIRAEQGKIPPFFVLRQEAEAASTQQELTNATRDVELSMLQLRTVMGVNPASEFSVPGVLEYQPSADFIARLTGAPSSTATSSTATSSRASANTALPSTPAPTAIAEPDNAGAPTPQAPSPLTSAPDGGSTVPPASTSASAAASRPNAAGLSAGLSALLRVAEHGRPELRAAELRISGAEMETSAISGSYRLQVNAFAMGDVGSSRSGGSFGGVTFGVAASVPLYTGGRRSAAIQTAQAERRRLEHERARIALEIAQGVSAAYLNLNASEQNILAAQAALRSAREDYRVALIRYEAGRSIVVEVLDAQATRVRAESNLVQALFGYNVALDQLLRAVGALDPAMPSTSTLSTSTPSTSTLAVANGTK